MHRACRDYALTYAGVVFPGWLEAAKIGTLVRRATLRDRLAPFRTATVFCWLVTLSACAPLTFKEDVAVFGTAVDRTAGAFEALHGRVLTKYRNDRMADFADEKAVIGVSPRCTGAVTEGQLARDASCLAQWAAYRATPEASRGARPSCAGASESVRGGEPRFYDFDGIARAEAAACRIGIRTGDGIDAAPLEDAEVLLTHAPRLIAGLKAYAAALGAIADAGDRAALQAAVGKAKDQISRLGTRVDNLDGRSSPYVSTIGPVASLVGAAFLATLEQRRYRALAAVTAGGDPVVTRAAMLLSNVAVPMMAIELQQAGRDYLRAFPDPGKPPATAEAWAAAYARTRGAREQYLSLFAASPTAAFRGMAEAHHALTLALAEPQRQYEALKTSIEDFAEKARAAHDAFEKAEATGHKAKPRK